MSQTSEQIANLAPEERRALLAHHLQSTHRLKTYPLSSAQQRMWFLNQLDSSNAFYNVPAVVRLKGPLSVAALQQSLNEIVRRHEVLRTTFATVDGQPIQIVTPSRRLIVPLVNLETTSESKRETEIKRLAVEEMRRSFDLARGPLLRTALLRLDEEEHVMFLTMHHIVCDAWSMGVFIKEIAALYDSFLNGQSSILPDLPIQYGDFAYWQKGWLETEVLAAQLDYWRRQLGGGFHVLKLPTDKPRPSAQSFRGATRSLVLPADLTRALKSFSQSEGVSVFMTLLAAFKALLHRYTGDEDILVGTPIANRNRAEIEPLIGLFVNTLVLRTSLSGDPSFRDLLARVREVALSAYAHQDAPFEKVVAALQPHRDLSRNPLGQVGFALQNAPLPALKLAGLSLSHMAIEPGTSKVDLTLFMTEMSEGLMATFEYSTDLFEAATISCMLENFQRVLEHCVANPQHRLSTLPSFAAPPFSLGKNQAPRADMGEDIYQRSNLTKNQLLFWVGQKLQPDFAPYNMAGILIREGEINLAHLERSFQVLVNSSDALRTVIEEIAGVPHQRILSGLSVKLEVVDLSTATDAEAEARVWARQRSRVQFDLTQRLFDVALIKLADRKYAWYLNHHQMIADAWSSGLICQRVSEFYEQSLNGKLSEVVVLPSFQDYLNYEKAYRNSPRYVEEEVYWKQRLAEHIEPLTLYGKTSLQAMTFTRRLSYDLGSERTHRLKAIARQEGIQMAGLDTSLFVIFATLLFTYLSLVSGNKRLAIGTPFHNRRSKAFKETIGLFVEVLPLRLTIEPGDTFLSLIKRTSAEFFESLKHGQHTIGNPIQSKTYDVFLNYHTTSFQEFLGLTVKSEWIHPGYGTEPLALQVHDFDQSGNIVLDFDLDCDVFSEEQSERTIQHFIRVLDAFLDNSAQPIRNVSLLTDEEKHRILVEFNRTEQAFPDEATLAQLFEAQVQSTPHRVAVVCEGQALTFDQLNSRANRMAHRLQALGVGAEVAVAILLPRGIELLTAILGVFKAGGAYLPLDRMHPRRRLTQVLKESGVRVAVGGGESVAELSAAIEGLAEESRPRLVEVEDWASGEGSEGNLGLGSEAGNLAYVIYTSGSTGVPKGAMIEQRGMINHLYAKIVELKLSSSDIIAQTAAASFDISVWQFLGALLVGGRVEIISEEAAREPRALLKRVGDAGVTVLEVVPSLLRAMLEEVEVKGGPELRGLRWLVVTGEALPPELCRRWLGRYPETRLLNAYGPTECSDDVTHYVMEQAPPAEVLRAPIGRGVANARLYVVDESLRPVPVGVNGELLVGGVGVGRGYLNHAERTAAVFIPDPFSEVAGARLYRTGDLVRYLPEGNLEFLGRIDQQVKLRGYRIELGEIEAVLNQHSAVREAAVVVRDDRRGDKQLVAYLIFESLNAPSVNELKSYLKERLPDYMVPAAFVELEALALTANGKIDRRALPERASAQTELKAAYLPPQTEVERTIAAVWQQVLRLEAVGIEDNFFDLGGHSLLLVEVQSRLSEALGRDLILIELFKYPTISSLAKFLSHEATTEPSLSGVHDQARKQKEAVERRGQALKERRSANA